MQTQEVKEEYKQRLGESMDLTFCEGQINDRPCLYVYFDGLTDKETLASSVIKPLAIAKEEITKENLALSAFCPVPITPLENFERSLDAITKGYAVLAYDDAFWQIPLLKYERRAIQEPPTASVIKGPRAGFVEDIAVNVTLLRRRLKSKDLVIQKMQVGRYTATTVAVCYLTSIAEPAIVRETVKRISAIDIDGIIDSSYVAMLIEDDHSSPFSQIASQEKPDIVAAKLLEGRVAILVDGSPMVLTLPHLLLENFQDGDDYFKRKHRVSFVRILRLLGLFMATLLPAVYVAVQEYQYQLIPLKFMITIINATNGTPLSPTLEMFLVLILFDILNEASVRMPKYVGMALSIVGAIVLGETAVSAGLLSSPAVLIMALSAIGMYTTPNNTGTFGLIRLALLGAASILGVCGLIVGITILACYVANMRSFGTDFTAPYSPVYMQDLKDGFIKGSLADDKTRPASIPHQNDVKQV